MKIMEKIIGFIRIFVLGAGAFFISLFCSCTRADATGGDSLTFYSFDLNTSSGIVTGIIDDGASTVTFPGISDPSTIT